MKIPPGKKAYATGTETVKANGLLYSEDDLSEALANRVAGILRDDTGRARIKETLQDVADTDFSTRKLEQILSQALSIKPWQVGEAIAEAFLEDHKQCDFPWPICRDLRNPNASPAGADLVGFRIQNNITLFAFGEVKTSEEQKYPPQVVTSPHGLVNQLKSLRDSRPGKDYLVIVYLGYRYAGTPWERSYKAATALYLKNPENVSLFGILIRDVKPDKKDLRKAAIRLGNQCPKETSIELYAVYLPERSIRTLTRRADKIRKTAQ